MKRRFVVLGAVAIAGVMMSGDLLACGDKILMNSRGTRYHRPKNFRAASVLIYADPTTGLSRSKIESILKSEGHRSIAVQSFDQLSAILAGGRFDVVLAAGAAAPNVERVVGGAPDGAVVVALDTKLKDGALLKAIDKAVEKRDQNLKKLQTRS